MLLLNYKFMTKLNGDQNKYKTFCRDPLSSSINSFISGPLYFAFIILISLLLFIV